MEGALVNVVCRWITRRIATDILRSSSLIYSNVIDEHVGRKLQMREILVLERRRHPEIKNNILKTNRLSQKNQLAPRANNPRCAVATTRELESGNSKSTNHWFFRDESATHATDRVRANSSGNCSPRFHPVNIPGNVRMIPVIAVAPQFEGVCAVSCTAITCIGEIADTRDGLLIWPSLIRVPM